MNVQSIPLDRVAVGTRLRAVDEAYAALLADSIAEHGLRTPIEVREPDEGGRYHLVAGAHRVAAARLLGLPSVSAAVLSMDDFDAQWREIDENLVRRDLSELDRGTFLSRRQALFFARFPDARRGRNQHSLAFAKSGKSSDRRFTQDIAAATRLSERAIYRAIRRADALSDVRHRLIGTAYADNGSALDAIARIPPGDRTAVVDLLVEHGGSVAQARARHEKRPEVVRSPAERQRAALEAAWTKASPEVRREFLSSIGATHKKGRTQ